MNLKLVGAHGGAGTSTLASICRVEEIPLMYAYSSPGYFLMVARTNYSGMEAARLAIIRGLPNVVGCVFVADSPGALPKSLRDLKAHVGGAFPRTWDVSWVTQLRFGQLPKQFPRSLAKFVKTVSLLEKEIQNGNSVHVALPPRILAPAGYAC